MSRQTFFYTAIGAELSSHTIDFERACLSRTGSLVLAAGVQYAWQHPQLPILFVVCSDGGPGRSGQVHRACALKIDPDSGALSPLGAEQALPYRPIHCTVHPSGRYLLCAYNAPSAVTVHPIGEDGSLAAPIKQPELDTGIYAHQIRVTGSGKSVLLVTRGNDAAPGKEEDPGALKIFDFNNGRLGNRMSIAPGDGSGYGFGPRHLDIDPSGRWIVVSIERQNQMQVYGLEGENPTGQPLYTLDSLERSSAAQSTASGYRQQLAGAIHMHPNGRFVYQANRSARLRTDAGWRVAGEGGQDNLVVYALDPKSGRPSIHQHVPTGSIHVRTFAMDPSARLLIAATIAPIPVGTAADGIRLIPAALLLYAVGDDGRLSLRRQYDIDTRGRLMFWTGLVNLS